MTPNADTPRWTERAMLSRLYETHYPMVLRHCIRRLFVRQVAEDVTSEIFLEVVKSVGEFTGRTETDFANWLFAIATHRINATIRRSRRRRELLEAAVQQRRVHLAGGPPDPEVALDWATLYEAIASLSRRDQTLITLRSFEQLPYDRVARICGMKPVAARVAFTRALARLRKRLTKAERRRR